MRDPKLLQQLVNLERAVTSAADAAITQNQPITEGITMTEPTTITIYLAINEGGDFQVSYESADEAVGELQGQYGCEAVRTIALNVTLDLPKIEAIPVTVPAQSETPAEATVS